MLNPLSANAAMESAAIDGFPTTNGEVYAITAATDGSVYVAGLFSQIGGVSRNNLARVLSDNTVDPDFNPNVSNSVYAIELDEVAGVVYIGGTFGNVNSTSRNNLAGIDSDNGTLTDFNPNMNSAVYTLELNADRTVLYAGGGFSTVNGSTPRNELAALSTSTGIATAFDTDIDSATCATGAETVYDLLLDTETDKLYVAGHFYTINGFGRMGIALVDADTGTLDSSFNPRITYTETDVGGCGEVYSILKVDNTIYAGGFFDYVNGHSATARNGLAAFNSATGTVTAFNPNPNANVLGSVLPLDYQPVLSFVLALEYEPVSRTLYAGGNFTTVNGGVTRNELAGFDIDTGAVKDFNPNITTEESQNTVHALSLGNNGMLYAGGTFDHVGGAARTYLAAFQDPDLDSDGTPNTEEQAAPNNGDANNDSIPDSQQANVTSILNTDSNQYVTIVSPSGTTLSTTTAEAAPTEDGFTHLFGLTGFTISGVTPGDTIEVSLFYPNPDNHDPTTLTPKKYFPNTTSYQDLPTTAPTNTILVSETIDGQPTLNLTYNLTDGSYYDLDQTADGSITDPVSLASTNSTTSATADQDTETLADTGQNTTSLILLATLLLVLALYKARKLYT